jgi:hypothetical protein
MNFETERTPGNVPRDVVSAREAGVRIEAVYRKCFRANGWKIVSLRSSRPPRPLPYHMMIMHICRWFEAFSA